MLLKANSHIVAGCVRELLTFQGGRKTEAGNMSFR